MKQLSEKLLEIEAAFHVLGWQSDETFHPALMALVGDDLEVKCLNRVRQMWDHHEIIEVLILLITALQNEPEMVKEMTLEGTEDVRGIAFMTEGWAVVGTREEVEAKLQENSPTDSPDRQQYRVVMGVLLDELDMDLPLVWGAQRIEGNPDTPSVKRGYGGGLADLFVKLVKGLK